MNFLPRLGCRLRIGGHYTLWVSKIVVGTLDYGVLIFYARIVLAL